MQKKLDEIQKYIQSITKTQSKKNGPNKTEYLASALKKVEKKIDTIKKEEKQNAERINQILNVIMALANLDYSQKANITNKRNNIDAVALGINMLGEELQSSTISLREKEILLKEIHHRVKNNLQIISSLLNLQSQKIKTPEMLEMFYECRNRIQAMALVHEKLYETKDFANIDFIKYLQSLLQNINSGYGTKSRAIIQNFKIKNQPHYLKIDTAITCGLILNELITNCYKHAFVGKKSGSIFIHLELKKIRNEKVYLVSVTDDGIGIAKNINPETTESLGLQLVSLLTKQLNGDLKIERNNGTRFTLSFKPDSQ